MDEFSVIRVLRLISTFKKDHGRDIAEADLLAEHVSKAELQELVRRGAVDKYQVTNSRGSKENRYKAHRDWRSLRSP